METPADLQSAWAWLVVGSLAQAGVRDVVISPGSRSTPFVLAALESAALRCVWSLDERSAAHYALGQARATGRPTLVICTSGSAPANYFPAVVEASEAGVPLIVLSADRPPELLACGANQTTDQVHMYGSHVRLSVNLGEPRADLRSLRAARRVALQAFAATLGPVAGPVHVNAQARKPLEPQGPTAGAETTAAAVETLLGESPTSVDRATELGAAAVDRVIEGLARARRPVVLCGPADLRQGAVAPALVRFARQSGALVLAETTSQLRFGPAAEVVLGSFDTIWRSRTGRQRFVPDFVLQLGATPLSSGWERLQRRMRIPRVVVHPWKWSDPASDAEAMLHGDPVSLLSTLADRSLEAHNRDLDFAEGFFRAEGAVWQAVRETLEAAGDRLTEAAVAPTVIDALPPRSALVLGNSLPIRHADRWTRPNDKPLLVLSQRGVSGIDGIVSAAAGTASCIATPTTLLVGDVSFLHDVNGLELASHAEAPLVIVVIHNGGGRIFEQLPIGRDGKEAWLPYFTTPHTADLEAAAALYGCRYERVSTVSGLKRALGTAYGERRCTVVEARVPPTSAREQGESLADRVERALAAEVP